MTDSDSPVPTIPLEIVQAQTYDIPFAYCDDADEIINLSSGYTARAEFKTNFDDEEPVLVLTSTEGIQLGATDPNIVFKLTQALTQNLKHKRGVYDLFLIRTIDQVPEMAWRGNWSLIRKVTTLA